MSKSPAPGDEEEPTSQEIGQEWFHDNEDALRSVMEEMTGVYLKSDDATDSMKVQFGSPPHADKDGQYVCVDPYFPFRMEPEVEGANILRVIDDVLSHEIGHVNWSDLKSKQRFSEAYPGWGEIPGQVANILEDEYDDARRMREFYGLRSKRAYRVWLQMKTERFTPPVDEVEEEYGTTDALITGLHQLALGGYVKGIKDSSADVKEFCSYAQPFVKRVRTQDDPDERFKLFHSVMQLLIRYADQSHLDDTRDDDRDDTVSGEVEPAPASVVAEVDLPPDVEEAVRDMMEEVGDEEDLPSSVIAFSSGMGDSGAPDCPECGSVNTVNFKETVDEFVAIRADAPFSLDEEWVNEAVFIHDDEVAGFRVRHSADVPVARIESSGAIVEDTPEGVEILVNRDWYDDEETVTAHRCDDCGNEWVPVLGA